MQNLHANRRIRPIYPYIRFLKQRYHPANASPLGLLDAQISEHLCWPIDLDPFLELNNGRTLTLYDLSRIPWLRRTGITKAKFANGWMMAVAGTSVRYRMRVKAFDKVTMQCRMLGWDKRFLYLDQTIWRGDNCTNQMLCRMCVTDEKGIFDPATLFRAAGHDVTTSPALPDWVTGWADTDKLRPWPPEKLF